MNLEPQIWQTCGFGTVVGRVRRRTDWYCPFSGNSGSSGWVNGFPVRVRPTMAPGGGIYDSLSMRMLLKPALAWLWVGFGGGAEPRASDFDWPIFWGFHIWKYVYFRSFLGHFGSGHVYAILGPANFTKSLAEFWPIWGHTFFFRNLFWNLHFEIFLKCQTVGWKVYYYLRNYLDLIPKNLLLFLLTDFQLSLDCDLTLKDQNRFLECLNKKF